MTQPGVDWAAVARSVQGGSLKNLGAISGLVPPSAPGAAANNFTSTSEDPQYRTGSASYNSGVQLAGPLTIPQGIQSNSEFTWAIQGDQGADEAGVPYSNHHVVQMTIAGGLAWLRDLSVHNRDQYNIEVGRLVQAGYLTAANARLNKYSTEVGNAFVRSAVDVIGTNNDASGGGGVTTWDEHIDQMIAGRKAMGQLNADGSPVSGSGSGSGSGAQAPVEQDVFTDPATVKHYINQAAEDVLGRQLTDDEAAKFQAAFHGSEAAWNKAKFASDTAQANGQASSATTAPSASVAAEDYIKTAPGLAGERTQQLVGSYVGVLRSMFGAGSGGVSNAVQ